MEHSNPGLLTPNPIFFFQPLTRGALRGYTLKHNTLPQSFEGGRTAWGAVDGSGLPGDALGQQGTS